MIGSAYTAIAARGLGKCYAIASAEEEDSTIGEALWNRLRRGFRGPDRETFWALREVCFDIPHGEVVGVIGPNGAGKSTLLKILSRITEPTTGRVDLYGRTGSLLEVGTGFHRELTGRENVFLNGGILGMRRQEISRHLDEIVEFAGVGKFLDTPVKHYSSGMYVRLAFAVAAHLKAEVLMVDEVLAVGDAEFQRKCLGKMSEVAEGGRTVLFVSHNMAAVRSLCKRAFLLDQGGVVYEGDPEEAVNRYLAIAQPPVESATVRFERPADVAIWMREARVYCNRRLTTRLEMGDELSIEVDFHAERSMCPEFGVILRTTDRTGVLHFNTRYDRRAAVSGTAAAGTLRCDLGQVPLTGGEYSLTLFIGTPSFDTHTEVNRIKLEVLEKDIFGSGRPYKSRHSLFWWPAKMELRGEPSD